MAMEEIKRNLTLRFEIKEISTHKSSKVKITIPGLHHDFHTSEGY